jgi:beta-galactosidase/beta-glucuronidase
MNTPRPEYPRPQLERTSYINLNGEWQFEIDHANTGCARGLPAAESLSSKIIVPFCPESELSGVGYKDFMAAVWYKKVVNVTDDMLSDGKRTILNIGACDFDTTIYVNGNKAGNHIGGYVSFSFDITSLLVAGDNIITIHAADNLRAHRQAAGKQSDRFGSYACSYTRTTGIWQTVWLEVVPTAYIKTLKLTPNVADSSLLIELNTKNAADKDFTAEAFYEGKSVGKVAAKAVGERVYATLKLSELHLWGCLDPKLYDLKLTLDKDEVKSYFGMRDVRYIDGKMYLNGKVIFQRLVLDQGFYPDGIYTAPSDEALIHDIKMSMDLGFNGARLHQKVFEERFLYHCDKLGYIVWGEHANWMLDISGEHGWEGFAPEWLEIITRDYSHPAIVGWCPLNETQKDQNPNFVKYLVDMTHAYDGTRPCIDCSGWWHVENISDVMDVHDYNQDPVTFKEFYDTLNTQELIIDRAKKVKLRPSFVSEYGGIWWNPQDPNGWGYGARPKDEEEFITRFVGLTEALIDNPSISALCYTQLTDVEQEQNGLYKYDRTPKFNDERIKKALTKVAAIEKTIIN